jgi:hypothetical protein
MMNISFKTFLKGMVERGWPPDQLDVKVGVDTICSGVTEITVESMSNLKYEKIRIERLEDEPWRPDAVLVTYILNLVNEDRPYRSWAFKKAIRFWKDEEGWSTDSAGNPPPQIVVDAFESLRLVGT